MARISIGETVDKAWAIVKPNWLLLAGLTLVEGIFQASSRFPMGRESDLEFNAGSVGMVVLGVIVSLIITVAATQICLRLIDGKKVTTETIPAPFSVYLNLIGASILVGLVVLVGLVALIIPGLYFALLYSQTNNLIIDKRVGVLEGMSLSAAAMRGNMWYYIGVSIVLGLIALAGFIALGVGALITVPIAQVGMLLVYRSLAGGKAAKKEDKEVEAIAAPEEA